MTRKYTKRNERWWGDDVGKSHHPNGGYVAYRTRRHIAAQQAAQVHISVLTNIISAFFYPHHLDGKGYARTQSTQYNGLAEGNSRETSSGFSSNDNLGSPGWVTPGAPQGQPGTPARAHRFLADSSLPGVFVLFSPRRDGP